MGLGSRLEKKRKKDSMCDKVESSICPGQAAGGAASGGRNVQDEIRARCVLELNLYLSAAHNMTVQDVPPDGDSIASWWAAQLQTAPIISFPPLSKSSRMSLAKPCHQQC